MVSTVDSSETHEGPQNRGRVEWRGPKADVELEF